MDSLFQDLRYALRMILKRPGFSIIAITTMALGIGASTAIFTVVNSALVRSLPYDQPQQLVHLWETNEGGDFRQREASYPDYIDWKENSQSFSGVAGYNRGSATLTGGDLPERVQAANVTRGFFDLLGVKPALGASFPPGEDRSDAERLVMLSNGLWHRRFGDDPNVVGRSLLLDGNEYIIVGVLPATFKFAPAGTPDLWLSLRPTTDQMQRRSMHWLNVIGRLKPAVSVEQASADMAGVSRSIQKHDPEWHRATSIQVVPLHEQIVGKVRPVLFLLLCTVGLVLLIACANVANLTLARGSMRQGEIAIRIALGADRRRIIQQLMTESLLIALLGGAFGLWLAQIGVRVMVMGIPAAQLSSMPYLQDLSIDGAVFSFAVALTFLTGLFFGLIPALQMSRPDIQETLKETGRTANRFVAGRFRNALVISELALALTLLSGAGLMMKSLVRLLQVDPGFSTDHLLTMQLAIPPAKFTDNGQLAQFHEQILSRVESVPGVKAAGTVDLLPLSGGGNTGSVQVEGRPAPTAGDGSEANLRTVSSSYFELMGLPLLNGRFFDKYDTQDSANAIVVNKTLANRLFPNDDPVGQRVIFRFSSGEHRWNIVGVVGDEKVTLLDRPTTAVVYFPYAQVFDDNFGLVVRTTIEPSSVFGAIRGEIQRFDRDIPIYGEITMDQLIAEAPSTFLRRYPAFLIGIFACVALILAVVGVYGVISYSVSQRKREIAIRLALGANPRSILTLVVGHGLLLTATGVGLGLAGAFFLARGMSSLLFGVTAGDPLTFVSVSVLLSLIAILASYLPARRAMRVDPMETLRCE
jgi:putative ABC transport system permease protein